MATQVIFCLTIFICMYSSMAANPPPPATTTVTGYLQFNFGDSNSDTGGSCAATGFIPFIPPDRPYSCRLSNGLLYIDYLAENLGTGLLMPYMDPLHHSNFSNGANFAISSMTAQRKPEKCYPLSRQVKQFEFFKYRALNMPKGTGPQITGDGIRNAIFSIDIGQNDLFEAFADPQNQQEIKGNISAALKSIEVAAKELYGLGARKFVLYHTGPLGCLPIIFGTNKAAGARLDSVGCVASANDVAREFNKGLHALSDALRKQLTGAIVVDVNMFDIKYNLIVNTTFFGFENPLVQCLTKTTVCLNSTKAVYWDSIHYTDSANKAVASMIFSGDYGFPYWRFSDLCNLNISVPQ